MSVPENGIYRIATAIDTNYIWDLNSVSQANEATLFIYTNNGGNNQKILLKDSVSVPGCKNFILCHSEKAVDLFRGYNKNYNIDNGDDIIQYNYIDNENQRWYITDTKSSTGASCFFFENWADRNYVIDLTGGVRKLKQNIIIYRKNDGDNQKWIFFKEAYLNSSMAVPSDVGVGTIDSENQVNTYAITSEGEMLYPMWKCNGSKWQLRYRRRGRAVGSDSYGSWEAWKNLAGSTSESGWANIWSTNCEATGEGLQKKSTKGIFMSMNTNVADKYEYQFEVRLFGTRTMQGLTIPQTGNTASGTLTLVYKPTITINDFVFTHKGLTIVYTSDFKRENNDLTLSELRNHSVSTKYLTVRSFEQKGKSYTGSFVIPFYELTYVPANGELIDFTMSIKTIDAERTQEFTRPISYNASHGLDIDAEFTYVDDGAIVECVPAENYPNTECHIIYEQDGEVVISVCEYINGKYIILPPLNKDYIVMMSGGDEDKWGVKSWQGERISSEGHLFNFDDTYFRLLLSGSPYASPSVSYSSDSATYLFQGDRRESVFFNKGAQVGITSSGICPIDITKPLDGKILPKNCSLDDFHKLRVAKYAVYRDVYGRRYDVAITSTDENPYYDNLFSVSITMKERM